MPFSGTEALPGTCWVLHGTVRSAQVAGVPREALFLVRIRGAMLVKGAQEGISPWAPLLLRVHNYCTCNLLDEYRA
jgi:hypothetical protein